MIAGNYIVVQPKAGDNYPYLQERINYAIKAGKKNIVWRKGNYKISKPLDCELPGQFFSLNMIGEDAAHFNLETSEARLICDFNEGYAINYQMARSSLIKGLVIYGGGIGADSQFKPFTGIAVDYHYNGTASGSSAILIRECRLRGFTAGICLSPNGITLNAENIHIEKCSIDNVKVAIATCQRQSKQNTVRDLICWDNVDTVFDGKSYGQCLGVMPYIDGANIAGYVKRVFNYGPQLFATSAQKVFAETIQQIGEISDGACGVTIRDSHFDFAYNSFPAYHFKGNGIKWDNVSARYYDDKNDKRIIIDGVNNMFMNGYADKPFLMKNSGLDELKRTNYYFNYDCVPESKTRVVPHSELETWEHLDQQVINVEEKTCTVNRPHNAKEGDYLDMGHPFYPRARVKKVNGQVLELDCITDGEVTGSYNIGINGLK